MEERGAHAVLAKGDGYFYFWGGEAADWLDRTVRVPTLHNFTLEQWIEQFHILSEKNSALLSGGLTNRDLTKPLAAAKKPGPRPGKKRNPR